MAEYELKLLEIIRKLHTLLHKEKGEEEKKKKTKLSEKKKKSTLAI